MQDDHVIEEAPFGEPKENLPQEKKHKIRDL